MNAKLLEEYPVTLRHLASCCYSLYAEFQLLWVTHVEAQVVLETAPATFSLFIGESVPEWVSRLKVGL